MPDSILAGRPQRVLLLGGTSEIGLAVVEALGLVPESEVILAGRDAERLAAAGHALPCQVSTVPFDATSPAVHQEMVDKLFAEGSVDIVISAAGVLVPQSELDQDVARAAVMVETNFT